MRASNGLLKRKLCRLFYLSITFVGVFLLVMPLSTGAVYSAQVTLAWDANSASDQITSYSIHYKTGLSGPPYDGQGASQDDSPIVVSVGALSDPDDPQYTIYGLSDNETYHLAITASNAYGQSGYSSEVSFIKESPGGIPDLKSIEIEGPFNVNENTTADFSCRAYYTDGTNRLVEPDTWDVDCSYAGISATGLLTTYDVDSDQACQLTASYTEGAINSADTYDVTIRDSSTPPPTDVIPQTGWSLWYVDSEELVGTYKPATYAFDGNPGTWWHTEWFLQDPLPPHEIQIDLGEMYELSGFRYLPRTDGGQNGRIADYEFYVSDDGVNWGAPVASGTFPNAMTEQEVLFGTVVTGQYIRLVALSEVNGNAWTSVAELNVLGVVTTTGILDYIEIEGPVNINENTDAGFNCRAYYTDGTNRLVQPDTWDVDCSYASVSREGLLTTYDVDSDQACQISASYTEGAINSADTYDVTIRDSSAPPPTDVIPQTGWSLWYVDSEELVGTYKPATYAFDGNPGTWWHTEWFLQAPPPPHEIQIDLGEMYELSGFRYLPRTDGGQNGRIADYEFYVSDDGVDWGAPVASGTFPNTMTEQEVLLGTVVTGQYIRLVALSEVNGNAWTSVAELNVLGVVTTTNLPFGR